MDPVIFSVNLGPFTLTLHWYGVLVGLGVAVSGWLAEREIRRRGENPEHVWNALLWLLPAGVIGARLWYVVNATLGGNTYYLENPGKIIAVWEGGLHFYGALLFGILALLAYARKYRIDLLLFLDVIAPITLIGQAIARPANFINQELYGQPTTLPWGIPIDAQHRLPIYADLTQYPVETTRFHPAFAYEMIWNFALAGLILWAARRWPQRFKPGMLLACWLMAAGVGRVLVDIFRPDQPRIPGTDISYTQLVSALMAVLGLALMLVRLGRIRLPWLTLPDEYTLSPAAGQPGLEQTPPSSHSPRKVRRGRRREQ